MTFDQHLKHLLWLMQPPHTNGWWAYAKARAEELAMADGAFASLPALLHAEHQRIAEEAKASRPQPSTGSSLKPAVRQGTELPAATPAAGRMTARRASISPHASS